MTGQERDTLGTALSSGDRNVVLTVLSKTLPRSPQEPSGGILPRGSTVTVEGSTFHQDEPGVGTVEAQVTGPLAGRYVLVLVWESDTWRVLTTQRLS
jgi:hypothetical protein